MSAPAATEAVAVAAAAATPVDGAAEEAPAAVVASEEENAPEPVKAEAGLSAGKWLIPRSALRVSASLKPRGRAVALTPEQELSLRSLGTELIYQGGAALDLPQFVLSSAAVHFQRFFYKKSFASFAVWDVAASALFLACKTEERIVRMKDVINGFMLLAEWRAGYEDRRTLVPGTNTFHDCKDRIQITERHLMRALGFVFTVEHPHKFILNYFRMMAVDDQETVQRAWNYANDMGRTTLCLLYPPNVLAAACMHLAARDTGLVLPTAEPVAWYVCFEVAEVDMEDAARDLLHIYDVPTADLSSSALAGLVPRSCFEAALPEIMVGVAKRSTTPMDAASTATSTS